MTTEGTDPSTRAGDPPRAHAEPIPAPARRRSCADVLVAAIPRPAGASGFVSRLLR